MEQLEQIIKSSYMCIFLDWARVYIDDPSMAMIGLMDWFKFN